MRSKEDTIHQPVRDHQEAHDTRGTQPPQKGPGAWLARHRRPIIMMGAAITLVSYFFKDVSKESLKDDLAAMNAGASEYRINLPLVEQQTTELISAEAMVQDNAASPPRDKVLIKIASLTYRQELNANEVGAFWKNMPDVPTSNLTEIEQMVAGTDKVTEKQKTFVEHPPSDARAFQIEARSLVKELVELNDRAGKTGADLQAIALEQSDRLEQRSSLYGRVITTLYLFGLALTVVTSLYGVEAPKNES
jgi:hypothetical protein